MAAYPVCVAVARGVEFVRIQQRITQQNTQHLSVALHGGQVSRGVAVVVDSVRTDELQEKQNHVRLIILCGHMQKRAASRTTPDAWTCVAHNMFYAFQFSFPHRPKQFILKKIRH